MSDRFVNIMKELLTQGASSVASQLQQACCAFSDDELISTLRLAFLDSRLSPFSCMQIANLWKKYGSLDLKPNSTDVKLYLLSDATTENNNRLLEPLAAARGIKLGITNAPFDSVEQIIFNPASNLYADEQDIVFLQLSNDWLAKHLGSKFVISPESVSATCQEIRQLVTSFREKSNAQLLLCPFLPNSWFAPSGMVNSGRLLGRSLAIEQLNLFLTELSDSRTFLLDVTSPLLEAGGVAALGRTNLLRARMTLEMEGQLAFAREVTRTIAGVYGKSHRAVVTDWDNTLWGGLVAEENPENLRIGVDNPEALGYKYVQNYLKNLQDLGVVLAAASRNLPHVAETFEKRPDFPLALDDFASLQVSLNPKSHSIGQIATELGFGAEYMLFLDDSIFELTEAISAHPYLDILLAGPSPENTLERLSFARPGHNAFLLDADQQRAEQIKVLGRQRTAEATFADVGEFLASIDIQLAFTPLCAENEQRVAQLFAKTNQFNLTTRRHSLSDLQKFVENGAKVMAVEYEDKFGSQGIISAFVLLPRDEGWLIESWLMSCRVLNRGVEEAVFDWMQQNAGGVLVGEYIPTAKNTLVKELYKELGFAEVLQTVADEGVGGKDVWEYQKER